MADDGDAAAAAAAAAAAGANPVPPVPDGDGAPPAGDGDGAPADGAADADAPPHDGDEANPVLLDGAEDATSFALMPSAAIIGVIDFKAAAGRKLYQSATMTLSDPGYDCDPLGLHGFLQLIHNRANEYEWNDGGILSIPIDATQPMINQRYLVTEYGRITLTQIRAYETTYVNTPTRGAQDNNMLFICLMRSLSTEGRNKVVLHRKEYHLGSRPTAAMLLKIIIRESHVDTNATSSTIRQQLGQLDIYIGTVGHNIIKFNEYVLLLIESLNARGESSSDVLVNLFKGYSAASIKPLYGTLPANKRAMKKLTEEVPPQR